VRVGIDYRTALVNREGIGRATRELVRALARLPDAPELQLFGWTLARSEVKRAELGLEGTRAHLARLRFPSRWIPRVCRWAGRGADDLAGGCDVFHHTQTHVLPVRRAVETSMVFDCIWARPGSGLTDEAAERMAQGVRALSNRCARIFVPTRFVQDDLVRTLGLDSAQIVVTHLGCDHVLRNLPERLAPPAQPYVLTVSRVDARKNHVRMLRVFERLAREGFPHRWIVAGPRGFGAEEFERALEASSARECVERREFVPDAELAPLYAGASLFLFASLDEGFGLPPLEAMACGAPVVASSAACLPEVLADGALLPDPRDEDALFEAARRVLSDAGFARDLARRGRERAAGMTWTRCAKASLRGWRAASAAPAGSTPHGR
jgi:glycosyltransferase involved in cell wall biosynthesis